MFNSLFISSYSTNIFNTLGVLEQLKKSISDAVVWNTVGSSSLIIFFKILGFNYTQTLEKLKELELCNTFINGFSIMIENEEEKKDYIYDFLAENFDKNKLVKNKRTLGKIYQITNIFPCFLVWDKVEEKIVNINPKTKPEYDLLDCVMASLTGIGTFKEYNISDRVYSNLQSVDCFPYKGRFNLENKLNTLYIFNDMSTCFEDFIEDKTPLFELEDEILRQQIDRNKMKLKEVKEKFSDKELVIVRSNFSKKEPDNNKVDQYFKNGVFQGESFLLGEDTIVGIQKQNKLIEEQN